MEQAKIAVLGCGHWGKNLVRNMAGLKSLAAVSDPNAEIAQNYAAQHGVRALTLEEILKDASIDGVMIASPSFLHEEQVAQCLNAGKHVFVEKPLALSKKTADNLVQLAADKNRVLMAGHLLHYHPAFLALLEQIQNGAIGTLHSIEARRLGRGPLRIHDNVLYDLASHDVSMVLRAAGGMPERIAATGHAIVQTEAKSDVPFITEAHLDLTFQTARAHIHVSWLAAEKEHKFIAIGDKGALVFDDTKVWAEKLALHRYHLTEQTPRWTIQSEAVEYIAVPESEPLKNECRHFLDCIRNGQTPRTDGAEAARVVAVIETAQNKIMEQA